MWRDGPERPNARPYYNASYFKDVRSEKKSAGQISPKFGHQRDTIGDSYRTQRRRRRGATVKTSRRSRSTFSRLCCMRDLTETGQGQNVRYKRKLKHADRTLAALAIVLPTGSEGASQHAPSETGGGGPRSFAARVGVLKSRPAEPGCTILRTLTGPLALLCHNPPQERQREPLFLKVRAPARPSRPHCARAQRKYVQPADAARIAK